MPFTTDSEHLIGSPPHFDHSARFAGLPLAGRESRPALLRPAPRQAPSKLFKSFWMAGYEGSDQINRQGRALSINALTQHHVHAASDYRRAADFGMHTVRESVGWRLSEHAGQFDFSHVEARARTAAARDVQVVWTLLHYGWPQDVDVLGDDFVPRFARYAGAAARYLKRHAKSTPIYVPIHEISYLSWALCEGELRHGGCTDLRRRGTEVKRRLVRAALAACDAIWKVDPSARILHTDPLIHIAAPGGGPAAKPAWQSEQRFEVWDMLCGRLAPELGGQARYLDAIGLNYFPGNQWDLQSGAALSWHLRDPRRVDLADLLAEVYQRYRRPLVIAETGHAGIGRGAWIREVASQVRIALKAGIPVEGICLYAVLDRPDWNNLSQWHNRGLWDLQAGADGTLERRLNQGYAADLRLAQHQLDGQLHALDTLSQIAASARMAPSARQEPAPSLPPRPRDAHLAA